MSNTVRQPTQRKGKRGPEDEYHHDDRGLRWLGDSLGRRAGYWDQIAAYLIGSANAEPLQWPIGLPLTSRDSTSAECWPSESLRYCVEQF